MGISSSARCLVGYGKRSLTTATSLTQLSEHLRRKWKRLTKSKPEEQNGEQETARRLCMASCGKPFDPGIVAPLSSAFSRARPACSGIFGG